MLAFSRAAFGLVVIVEDGGAGKSSISGVRSVFNITTTDSNGRINCQNSPIDFYFLMEEWLIVVSHR